MQLRVERRKAWRMLQSKAGIENREYKAQRAILADVEAGKISKEELFEKADQLLRDRLQTLQPTFQAHSTPTKPPMHTAT